MYVSPILTDLMDSISTPLLRELMGFSVYQVRKRFSDGRGAARVDKEGDLNVSFPKAPGLPQNTQGVGKGKGKEEDFWDTVDEEEVEVPQEDRHEAWRFLLAGGVAGAGASGALLIYLR